MPKDISMVSQAHFCLAARLDARGEAAGIRLGSHPNSRISSINKGQGYLRGMFYLG